MSSRTPAPEEFSSSAMPDLAADHYADDDSLYAPPTRRAPRSRPRDQHDQQDTPSRRQGRAVRIERRQMSDASMEERPGRRPVRRDPGEVSQERPRRRAQHLESGTGSPRSRLMSVPRRGELAWEEPQGQVPRPQQREPGRADGRPRQRSRRPIDPSRQDRVVEQPRMRADSASADFVTSIRPVRRERASRGSRRRNPAWMWHPIVMPQPRQILAQALPNLLMGATAAAVLVLMPYMPFGLPLWAPLLMLPMLALFVFADERVHPMWARAAIINLATVGVFFPSVIVRQSVLRVPFVEWGNGTLAMPILATIGVVILLATLALGSAVLSEEDPEYAGIIFLPAALMVPFFAGATEITSLNTAFMVMAGIYVASAALTVVASVLPGAYPTLVAPIALALEFLVLPLSKNTPIFPVGAGTSAKLLFFVVLSVAVGLTVAVPVMAVWIRQVRRLVVGGGTAARRSPAVA